MSWTLITNDDGITAPGLHALAAAAVTAGHRVVVAAPDEQASGAGTSLITRQRNGRVPTVRHELPDLPGVPAYGVGAQPAFIAFAAMRGWFDEPPALVLSGINEGTNLGQAVLHSGTVGAALTAGRLGARALAVSLSLDDTPRGAQPRWSVAAGLLPEMLALLARTPPATVLNLNVPDRAAADLGAPRAATLATRGRLEFRVNNLAGDELGVHAVHTPGEPEPGSDVALLAAGHPTLTAVRTVAEDPTFPLTDLLAELLTHP
ncbi:MAG TPA: 5'/3'-nucleotidase SurE [Pseudonocardia sp.]|nr:5'/3'-nucleotidase SurE [Pseudonocardia sp.]